MTVRSMLAASTAILVACPAQAQSPAGTGEPNLANAVDAQSAASPGKPQDRSTDGADGDASAAGLQDIIVTAQRREESLQRVPVAVTALSTQTLDQARITSVERLSAFAPNLTVVNQATVATPVITIRGINSGSSNITQDPKVATYLDGVYFGRNSGSIFDLADIERVEILRGPQGTLFGRNATAGAISLVTAAPTGEFGGKLLASYGNYNAFRARAVVNLPALGPLSIKLSYLHNEIEGDVRNLIGGSIVDARPRDPRFGPFRAADRLGGSNADAFQGKARLDLGDLLVDYSYDITDTRTVTRGAQVVSLLNDPAGALASAIISFQGPGAIPGYAGTGGITNLATTPQKELASLSSVAHVTVQGHSMTATYNLSPQLTIKNIAAWRQLNSRPNFFDIVATGGLRFSGAQLFALLSGNIAGVVSPAAQPGPNDRFFNILGGDTVRQNQFSDELQATYTSSLVDLTVGAFYFSERGKQSTLVDIFEAAPGGVAAPSPLDAVFGSGVTTTNARNRSYAGYAQATVHVTPQLDLTGGIRYTEDKRRATLVTVANPSPNAVPPGTYDVNFSRTNFTGIVTYRPNSDITAYAKVATGYVAGGLYNGIPFAPESLTAYEIGLKSQFFDNRLRLNVAAFYQQYKNLQVQDNVQGVVVVTNAGQAKIPGVEVEITAAPLSGLTLSGNLGYQDLDYKRYIFGGVDIASQARPLYTSKLTSQIAAQYELPEMGSGARPFGRVDARYQSRSYNTQTPLGTTDAERARFTPLSSVAPFWLVDGRVGVTKLPLGTVDVSLSGYVQNIFNVRRYDYGLNVLVLLATYNRPRTYGIELSAKF